jgi:Tol biopolymer transport system component
VATVTDPEDFSNPRVSPDGKKIAVCIYDARARTRDIWVLDLERGTRMRVTNDPGDDMNPAWSPDSGSIAFSSDRKGTRDIYRKELQGGEDSMVLESGVPKSVSDWSPDGRRIVFNGPQTTDQGGIAFVNATDGKTSGTELFKVSRFNSGMAGFSPDGKWVAFVSYETGGAGIYVSAASGGGNVLVANGGIQPRWSRDGREIFYLNNDRERMMVVPVMNARGATLEAGAPRELFRVEVADALGSLYDVSPDGRFLVNARVGGPIAPITIVLNWPADLESRAAR